MPRHVWCSIFLHFGVVLVSMLMSSIAWHKNVHTNLGLKVEVIALPDKKPAVPKRQKKITPKKTRPKTKSEAKPVPKLAAKKTVSLEDKLTPKTVSPPPTPAPAPAKGNILSEGSNRSGIEQLHFNNYYADLKAHVDGFWSLPQWLMNKGLKAQVLVMVSKNGNLKYSTWLHKSGNKIFDNMVLGTLRRAVPFPRPPKSLIGVEYALNFD